jgi:alpha-1,6-mannosyltransferase
MQRGEKREQVIIYALLSALVWLAVTLLSLGFLGVDGFFYDLPNSAMPFGRFFILYTAAFFLYLAVILRVVRLPSNKQNVLIILISAVVFRLILLPGIPVHENDIYRYIWDGKVALSGINPYKCSPIKASIKPSSKEMQADFEKLKSLRDEDLKSYWRISFKDVPTIYPPLAQAIFTIAAFIAPGSVLFMKFMFVLFDTGVIFLLFIILKQLKQNPLYVVIYAWNPLILKEFANSGHYDSLAIFCVMFAACMMIKEKPLFSAAGLGLGVLAKFYPLVFIPFFLIKKQYRAFFFSIFVIVAGYLVFFIWGDTGSSSVFYGLNTYTQEWVNNGFIYSLISDLVSSVSVNSIILSKIICGILYILIWIYIFVNARPVIEKMFLAVTLLFLMSPVGFPWYFCWVIPFLCIYRNWSMTLLSYLLIIYYFVFTRTFGSLTLGIFNMDWLMLIQYVPFLIILIAKWFYKKGLLTGYEKLHQ